MPLDAYPLHNEMACLSSLLLRQCCNSLTCLFTRNDLDEMGCLLALLLRQCCEGFTCLFTRHDLGAKCLAFGARVLHQHPPVMHHAGWMQEEGKFFQKTIASAKFQIMHACILGLIWSLLSKTCSIVKVAKQK